MMPRAVGRRGWVLYPHETRTHTHTTRTHTHTHTHTCTCTHTYTRTHMRVHTHILTVVPAVNLDAATALDQSSCVGIRGGLSVELVGLKVRVVTGVDEVMREWLGHVLVCVCVFVCVCVDEEQTYTIRVMTPVKSHGQYYW